MTNPLRLRALGALLVSVLMVAAVPRASAIPDPGAFIGGLAAQALETLGPQVPPDRRTARFRRLLRQDFDMRGIARFTLGRYWARATPTQRQEFLRLFTDFTAQVYSDRLARYEAARVAATGTRREGDQTVVSSAILPPNHAPVRTDWYLSERGGRYKIDDVAIDGVSMRMAEREHFARWIQRNDGRIDSLLAVLRQEIAAAR
jgi:phospholipid transport system substrate-binding protein